MDGELIVNDATQKFLCQMCDYTDPRGLRIQLAKLEDAGWIQRDHWQTGPKAYREYVLLIPESAPTAAIDELSHPSPGMWKRVLEMKPDRTGESEFTRYGAQQDEEQVNQDSAKIKSPELQCNNRGNEIPNQVNLSSPLKESISTSSGVITGGGSGKPDRAQKEEKKDWRKDRDEARRRLNLKPSEDATEEFGVHQ